jgi:hypothetical protein
MSDRTIQKGEQMKKRILSLSLSLVLLMIVALPVNISAESGSLNIGATVPSSISIVVPSNFNFSDIQTGSFTTSSAKIVTVTINSTDWTLTASESGGSSDGKMSTGTVDMKNALTIKGGDQIDYTPLSSTVTIKSGTTSGTTTIDDIYFRQQIASNESAGTYSITVTFTAEVDS